MITTRVINQNDTFEIYVQHHPILKTWITIVVNTGEYITPIFNFKYDNETKDILRCFSFSAEPFINKSYYQRILGIIWLLDIADDKYNDIIAVYKRELNDKGYKV